MSSDGHLYGTTQFGGKFCPFTGCGTVFEVSPPLVPNGPWTEKVIHSFGNWRSAPGVPAYYDGTFPRTNLVADAEGSLYGTTQKSVAPSNAGIVFKLTRSGGSWAEKELYFFPGDLDDPSPVIFGSDGALYGTTAYNVFQLRWQ
jgi:uncharacterized repeat protein (TIGR03803 family)